MTITLNTPDDLEAFMADAAEWCYFATSGGFAWIVYASEDGDMYATRPASEDDGTDEHGNRPGGITEDLESLALPVVIIAANAAGPKVNEWAPLDPETIPDPPPDPPRDAWSGNPDTDKHWNRS